MPIEYVEFSDESSLSKMLEGSVLRYCTLKNFSLDGKNVDSVFLSCSLEDLNWYWGLFNCCLFVDTKFIDCVFRGSNFADCRFLNCEFSDCRFDEDNFHSPCSFDGTQWFGGKAARCKGLPEYAFPAPSPSR
jgi:uncharacterized protein YjbI with pentapeptide repeats